MFSKVAKMEVKSSDFFVSERTEIIESTISLVICYILNREIMCTSSLLRALFIISTWSSFKIALTSSVSLKS